MAASATSSIGITPRELAGVIDQEQEGTKSRQGLMKYAHDVKTADHARKYFHSN